MSGPIFEPEPEERKALDAFLALACTTRAICEKPIGAEEMLDGQLLHMRMMATARASVASQLADALANRGSKSVQAVLLSFYSMLLDSIKALGVGHATVGPPTDPGPACHFAVRGVEMAAMNELAAIIGEAITEFATCRTAIAQEKAADEEPRKPVGLCEHHLREAEAAGKLEDPNDHYEEVDPTDCMAEGAPESCTAHCDK